MTAVVDPAASLDPELFLPEPEPRDVKYTVISVDDHLVEPPHMFEGRLPERLQERAPKVVIDERGHEVWEFEGERHFQVGQNAVAGRRPETVKIEPFRFDQMRPGCYDPHARVRDMDINGVWASLCFPSMITGFCGRVFSQVEDHELGFAVTQAWNDWMHEEWWGAYPERFIPLGITDLGDAERGAAEIRRNAARGFVTVSLPERPHRIGFPSIFDDHWEPIIRACADTGTVISLHVGSSGMADFAPGCPPLQIGATLFGQLSLTACAEWVWSAWGVKYPDLKIAMSEGGIGWVAMLVDRLDNIVDRSGYGLDGFEGLRPADVLRRNFWFCTIDDPSTIETRHAIGIDHVMLEVDYPHGDGTWPDTQAVIERFWGHVPVDELRKMTHRNAAALYRHPLPDRCVP
ncbi:MAG TPA: amidohydrolase family protein [Acidimicrobiia bacterium]|jgi:predicted TIM-barrel fold metal-dependent hydrolase